MSAAAWALPTELPQDFCDVGVRLAPLPAWPGQPPLPGPDAATHRAWLRQLLPGMNCDVVVIDERPGPDRFTRLERNDPSAVAKLLAAGAAGIALDEISADDLDPDGIAGPLAEAGAVLVLPPIGAQRLIALGPQLAAVLEAHEDLRILLPNCGGCGHAEAWRQVHEALPLAAEGLFLGLDGIADWELFRVLLRHSNHDCLVWGSGLPLSAEPGVLVAIGDAVHPVTAAPQPWSLHYPAGGPSLSCAPILHQCLGALATAVRKTGLRATALAAICHGNGLRLGERL